jgi:hypothetical protein
MSFAAMMATTMRTAIAKSHSHTFLGYLKRIHPLEAAS